MQTVAAPKEAKQTALCIRIAQVSDLQVGNIMQDQRPSLLGQTVPEERIYQIAAHSGYQATGAEQVAISLSLATQVH